MALAPIHLPAGSQTAASGTSSARRPIRRLLPARTARLERLTTRDALGSPSDISLRSVGDVRGMHR